MSTRHEIERFVSSRTGIEIARGGVDRALAGFVERRCRELDLSRPAYLSLLGALDGAELERLVNAITVGYTWFFRDPSQLAAIETIFASGASARPKLNVWIPACSTGEDAYSLSLLAERAGRDVDILATDVNSRALEHARRAIYGAWSVRELSRADRARFVSRGKGSYEVDAALRARVSFFRHNLIERPPIPTNAALWDVILCRNVLIYFTRDVARRVFEKLAAALAPGGYLLLGASEVVFDVPPDLEALYIAGRLVFQRRVEGAVAAPRPLVEAPRDWLVAHKRAQASAGLVSAFPPAVAHMTRSSSPPPAVAPAREDPLAKGHSLLDRGDAAAARDVYLGVVAADGTRADARMYAGVARYLCGEVEPALHELRAALFLDGELWPAAFYLALCYENSGHPEEALRAYHHVVRLDERSGHQPHKSYSHFDSWRADLCELARCRVREGARASH